MNLTLTAGFFSSCKDFSIDNIQGTEQRHGRLIIGYTYGPRTQSLSVPLIAEYFTADGWRTNTQDSCTLINLSQSGGDMQVVNAYAELFRLVLIQLQVRRGPVI
ncbi:MAG: DUF6701 domain-containing protein [Alteromonas sp.]